MVKNYKICPSMSIGNLKEEFGVQSSEFGEEKGKAK
jgi:hypothetical protein